jgi:hypothetical protein
MSVHGSTKWTTMTIHDITLGHVRTAMRDQFVTWLGKHF